MRRMPKEDVVKSPSSNVSPLAANSAADRDSKELAAESDEVEDETEIELNGEHVVDFDAALRRLGGDRQLLADLADFFSEDAPQLLQEMERSLQTRSLKAFQLQVHSLKGLLGNFGADHAAADAESLEEMAIEGRLPTPQQLSRLARRVRRVLHAVSEPYRP